MLGIPTVTITKESVVTGSATVATDSDGLLNSATNSITMTVDTSMLSFTPRHLLVRCSIRHNSADDGIYMKLNGDSGSNYNNQNLQGRGTTLSAARNTNNSSGAALWKADDETNEFSGGEFLIVDAFNTTTHKNVIGIGGVDHDHGGWLKYCRWADTSAVTSVAISTSAGNDMAVDSYFELNVVDEAYNIDEEILTGSSSSFDVSSITQANGYLVSIGNLRSDRASNDSDSLEMHYGTGGGSADTTATNYERQRAYGTGTTTAASADNDDGFAKAPAATATANGFGAFVHLIPNYSDGSNYRTALNLSGFHADSDKSDIYMEARQWRNTGGIDSFTLKPEEGSNFIAGSMLSTYVIPDSDGANTIIDRKEIGDGDSEAREISFTSIPTSYTHFEVISYVRVTRSSTSHFGQIGFNDENEGNQLSKNQQIRAFGTSIASSTSSDAEGMGLHMSASNTSQANNYAAGAFAALNYLRTDRHKMLYGFSGYADENSTDDGMTLVIKRGKITAAIDQFDLDTGNASFNWKDDSVVVLRGISTDIPVGGPADIKKINGIAAANIKKVNTIAKASLGKVNSIT